MLKDGVVIVIACICKLYIDLGFAIAFGLYTVFSGIFSFIAYVQERLCEKLS